MVKKKNQKVNARTRSPVVLKKNLSYTFACPLVNLFEPILHFLGADGL
jgi:hypothetical protein